MRNVTQEELQTHKNEALSVFDDYLTSYMWIY